MTVLEKYNRIVSELGTAILIVKTQIDFTNDKNAAKIYLHSFKLDTFVTTDNPQVTCSIYSTSKKQFYRLTCELKVTTSSGYLWQMDETQGRVIANDHCLDETRLSAFNSSLNTQITNSITAFLPGESRIWNALKDYGPVVFSSENVGILTNSLLDKVNIDEENFYLSDARIAKGTETKVNALLRGMTLPTGNLPVKNIELNGEFRISFE